MRIFKSVLLLLFIFVFLVACTEKTATKPEPKKEIKKTTIYAMSGQLNVVTTHIRAIGHSNLSPGTLLIAMVKGKRLGDTKVKKDGGFYLSFKRPKLKTGDQILILLKPELQTKKIKEIYGEKGENIKGEFAFQYKEDGQSYTGLKAGTYITVQYPEHNFAIDGFIHSPKEMKIVKESLKEPN